METDWTCVQQDYLQSRQTQLSISLNSPLTLDSSRLHPPTNQQTTPAKNPNNFFTMRTLKRPCLFRLSCFLSYELQLTDHITIRILYFTAWYHCLENDFLYKLLFLPVEDEEPLFYLYDSHTTCDNAFHFLVERRNISSNFIYVQFLYYIPWHQLFDLSLYD